MKTWKEDREELRRLITEKNPHCKIEGEYATLLFVLVSHMRGKLHMRSYKLYTGGWRGWTAPKRPNAVISEKLRRSYHDAQAFYERAVIETLEDQAEWLRQEYEDMGNKALRELTERVLANDYAVEERLTATA